MYIERDWVEVYVLRVSLHVIRVHRTSVRNIFIGSIFRAFFHVYICEMNISKWRNLRRYFKLRDRLLFLWLVQLSTYQPCLNWPIWNNVYVFGWLMACYLSVFGCLFIHQYLRAVRASYLPKVNVCMSISMHHLCCWIDFATHPRTFQSYL